MRRSPIVVAAAVILILTAAAAWSQALAADSCEDLLGDTLFRCQGKHEFLKGGSSFDECLRFNSSAPVESAKFDLIVEGLGDTLGCSCKALGSFNAPKFNTAKDFHCVTTESGAVWSGKVTGSGKIKNVQALFESGIAYVFQCVPDPTCALTLAPQTPDTRSHYLNP